MSLKTKIILIFSIVAAIGLGIILFFAYQGGLAKGLKIEMDAPEKVPIGIPFDFKVNLSNEASAVLEEVRLSVSLPDGLAFVGSPQSKNVDFRDLKTLGSRSLIQQNFKLIALNGENTFKEITASVSYLSGSLSSRFQKEESANLAIGGYGIALDIATPQKVFSGENFDAEISYKNASGEDFSDLKLKMNYPLTYTFIKSTLAPDIGKNTWLLGGLRDGSENKFKITGNIIGPEGAFFDLKATIQTSFLGQTYDISTNAATISIAESPLSLKISLNGEDFDYIVKLGDTLTYTLGYVNNTDVGLRDVIIKAQILGSMFNFEGMQTGGGSFRSSDNTIIWNASNIQQLNTIAPGQSGEVSFALRAKTDYPIRRLSDKNFTVKVSASIESPTVPNFVAANRTFSMAALENKVAGRAEIDSKAYFRDAASGILNKGPFPPRVNQSTQYTIHWPITSFSTDIKNVEVRAFLAGNVKFVGVVKSSGSSAPVYNERTQEIVWNIDRISATTGVISKPFEAIFQIEATPSSSDVGRFMELIRETNMKAIDEFTELELTDKDFSITTQLPDDPTVSGSQGMVTQ